MITTIHVHVTSQNSWRSTIHCKQISNCYIHMIHVETFRYLNISVEEEEKGTLCNMNALEDEMHFLCNGPMYINE